MLIIASQLYKQGADFEFSKLILFFIIAVSAKSRSGWLFANFLNSVRKVLRVVNLVRLRDLNKV